MIRKYKDLSTRREGELASQPFPDGIAALPAAGVDADVWREVMGERGSWGVDAEDMGWYKEVRGLCLVLDKIVLALDEHMLAAEGRGEAVAAENVAIEKLRVSFDTLAGGVETHRIRICDRVLPFVLGRLPQQAALDKELALIEKSYRLLDKRIKLATKSFDALIGVQRGEQQPGTSEQADAGKPVGRQSPATVAPEQMGTRRGPAETSKWLYAMRVLKGDLRVVQGMTLTTMQTEIHSLLYLLRTHCSYKEWLQQDEMGMAYRKAAALKSAISQRNSARGKGSWRLSLSCLGFDSVDTAVASSS